MIHTMSHNATKTAIVLFVCGMSIYGYIISIVCFCIMRNQYPALLLYVSLVANALLLYHLLNRPIRKTDVVIPNRPNGVALGDATPDLPGYYNQRLTHLVIPFHTSHLGRVESLLKSWQTFPPCSHESDLAKAQPAAPYHLVFYSSTDYRKREKIVEIEQRLQDVLRNLTTPVLRCFASFDFHHANLSGHSDKYYRGTRLMIEKLVLGKVRLSVSPQYAFYMEPDVQPVRANWLNALDASVRWPNQMFWMKGSLYRGNNKGVYSTRHPPQYYHINGCSIYNLGDRAFRSWWVKHYRPFVQSSLLKSKERSYDTDIYRYLNSMDHVEVARIHFSKFIYSDVIQNYWRSGYSLAKIRNDHPNTFLVHGGYQKP